MKRYISRALLVLFVGLLCGCNMMSEDYSDCPSGLYLSFKYDYNLERSDLFKGNVGSVTVYAYDTSDKLVGVYDAPSSELSLPFLGSEYWTMHITDLPAGQYRFTVLAQQAPYEQTSSSARAHFLRSNNTLGAQRESLSIALEKRRSSDGSFYLIDNHDLPLDTLWHGGESTFVELYKNKPSYDTISLVRDTKQLHVAIREIDDPTTVDIADYGMTITDRNGVILYNNELDESDYVVYTPYVTWNTDDLTTTTDAEGNVLSGVGHIAHADFMLSRLLYHEGTRASIADDGVLSIVNLTTGVEVGTFNLPALLAQLRSYDELHRYSEQEFLDRAYDFTITVFLRGGNLTYINIAIDILGWSKRIQWEDL